MRKEGRKGEEREVQSRGGNGSAQHAYVYNGEVTSVSVGCSPSHGSGRGGGEWDARPKPVFFSSSFNVSLPPPFLFSLSVFPYLCICACVCVCSIVSFTPCLYWLCVCVCVCLGRPSELQQEQVASVSGLQPWCFGRSDNSALLCTR